MRAAKPASDRDAYTTMPSANVQMITPESMSLARSEASKKEDMTVNYGT
jgi:hypothetical protein